MSSFFESVQLKSLQTQVTIPKGLQTQVVVNSSCNSNEVVNSSCNIYNLITVLKFIPLNMHRKIKFKI